MAGNTQKFTLQFQADTSQAKNAISQLQKSLSQLQLNNLSIGEMDADLTKAAEAAKILQSSLQSAVDVNTGKLNLTAFNNSLKSSGQTLSQLSASLLEAGSTGAAAFTALARSVSQSEVPLKNINKTLANIGTTLKNTIKWELSSTAVHGLESALSGAVNYVKDLNGSLTDIRIVTSASADEMARFAVQANKAAKELSTTTKAYADASLIYYQQGDNAELAAKKAAITIKAANSSFGTNAAEMSEYLTAVWNSYKVGADELERYVDIMAALGAKTATSLEEIATSMQKVAATSNTVGVSMEQVSSIISTVSSVTRESAESIGTSFKTIFARIGDLKLGETLEDGVDLGQVSSAISKIGVSILDANGDMRDMGLIIEELMGKWQNMSRAEQTALAQVIAGKRQYTQWMALMENSDMYKSNMAVAENATGELQKMQDIHAQSWEASAARVKAAWEGLYSSVINDKALINLNNGLEKVIEGVKGVADSFGGLGGILTFLSSIALTVFDKQIVGALDNFSTSITGSNDRVKNFTESYKEQMEVLKGFQDDTRLTDSQKIELQYTTQIMEAKAKLQESSKNLSSSQIAGIEKVISALEQERDLYVSLAKYDEQHGEGKAKANRKQMENQAFNLEGIKPVNFDYLPAASQQVALLAADFELINKYIETSTAQGREFSSIIAGLDVPEEKMSFSGILDQIELITRASQQAKNALSAMGNLGLHSDVGQFNQASLASGKDLNTLTADFTNVLNNIQPTGLQAFDEQIAKIKATLIENPPKDTEGLLGYIKWFEQAINGIDFSEFEKHINKFKEFGVKEGWFTEEQFNGWIEGMKNAGLSSEEMAGKTKDAIDRAKMSIKELTQESQTMSQTLTQMASGLTGLVTLFNGIKNSTDKLFDGNTNGAEKFGAAITLITSLCYGYIAANKLLTAILGKEKLELLQQKLVTDQLTWAHIKATAAETGHSVAMTVLKMVTNGVSVAFKGLKKALDAIKNHPIVLILTAIVAAAGLIVTVINKIKEAAAERAKEARQHAQDRIQELKEETKILAEEEKAADNAYEAYKQQEEARQKTGTASQDYYNSVDTLLEALGQEELKVLAVTGQYERLAQAIEEANTKRIQQNALAAVGNVASAKNMADMLFSNYDTEGLYADKIGKNGRFYYIDNIYDEIQSEFAGTGIDIGTILTEAGFSFNDADMHINGTDPQALANVFNALSNLDNLDVLLETSAGFKQVYDILEATGGLITSTQISSASTIGANYLTSNFSEADLQSGGINYHTMEQSVKDYLISEGLLDPNTPEINTVIQDIISDYLTSLGENFTEQLQTYELANLGINDLQMSDTQLKAIIEAAGGEQAFYSQMAQTGSESYLLSSLTNNPEAFSEALTLLSDYGAKRDRYQKRGPLIDSLKQIVEDSDTLKGSNEQDNATIEELFMQYYEDEKTAMAAYEQFLLQSDDAQKTTIVEMTNALVDNHQALYNDMVTAAQKAYSTIDSLSQDFINNQMANNPLFGGMQVDFQNPKEQSYDDVQAQANIEMAQALHGLLVDMASGSFEGFYRWDENSDDLFTLDPKYSEELVEAFISYLIANGADETEVREQILYTPDGKYADSVFWGASNEMPEQGTMPFDQRIRTAASLALGLIDPEGIDAEQQMLGIWQGGQKGLATQADINAAIALMDQERIMRARDAEIAAVAYSEETGIKTENAEPKLNLDGTEIVTPEGEEVILNGNIVVDNFDAFSSMLNFDSALTDSNLTALQALGIDIAELEQKWSSIKDSPDYAAPVDKQKAWSDYISTLAQEIFDSTARQKDADTSGKTIVSDTEYAEMRQTLFGIKDSAAADAYEADVASIESTIQEYEELDEIIANLDIETIAKLGSASWEKLSVKIGKTKEEFLALSKIDQAKLLNKNQVSNLQNMASEYDDLAAKAKEYAVQAQSIEERDNYLAKAKEYEQLAAEARAEAEATEAELITNIIEISDAAAERLTNAMQTSLDKAEKTKEIASILDEAIDTGNLTAIQQSTLEMAGYDLSIWTSLADDTARAAEAARLWKEYAAATTVSGETLSAAYQTAFDLLNARTFTDDDKYSNLNNKDNYIQYMEHQYHATEETLGLISQAWDSLESKGVDLSKMNNAEITKALKDELNLLQTEIKNTSTEAAAEAKDRIVEIYSALAGENISAAQAAADAWINAFKQIADARAKLLAGENLMADIAGNPEQLLQYAKTAGMDPATMAKQIIGGTLTAEQLALPKGEEYINSEMAKYGFDQINSSGLAFGTTGRFNDAAALGVSASTEEGQKYLAQYYQAILQATGMTEKDAAEHALQIAQGKRQYSEIATARGQLISAIEGAALAQEEYQKQTEALNAAENQSQAQIKTGLTEEQIQTAGLNEQYTGQSQERMTALQSAITNLQEEKYREDGQGSVENLSIEDQTILKDFGINMTNVDAAAQTTALALVALAQAAYDAAEAQYKAQGYEVNKNDDGTVTVTNTEGGEITEASTMMTSLNQGVIDAQNASSGVVPNVTEMQANSVGMEPSELESMARAMHEAAATGQEFSDLTVEQKNNLLDLAATVKRCTEGWEELRESQDDNIATVKKGDKENGKYFKSLGNLTSTLKKIFGNSNKLTEDFVEKHIEDIEKMADGDEEALERIEDALISDHLSEDYEIDVTVNTAEGETNVSKLGDLIDNFEDQWSHLAAGTVLTPEIDTTGATAALLDLVNAGGETANSIMSALNSIGWTPEVEYETVPAESVANGDGTVTVPEVVGYEQGIPIVETVTKPISSAVNSNGEVVIPKIGKNGQVQLKGFKKAGSSGKGSSGGSGGGGGGGGGSASKHDKLEARDERYHEVTENLKRIQENLDEIDKAKNRAYGQSHLDNLKKENELLQKQRKEQERYLEEIMGKDGKGGYLKIDLEAISSDNDLLDKFWEKFGVAEGERLQFEFDAEGNISNWEEVMEKVREAYNAKADVAMTDEQWEKYEEIYQDLIDGVADYEETLALANEQGLELQDILDAIQENNLAQITYKVEYQTEINENDLELLEYYAEIFEDDLSSFGELMTNLTQQAAETTDNLSIVQQGIADLNTAYANGDINLAQYQEALADFNSQLLDNLSELHDLEEQIQELYADALDKAQDELDKHLSKLDYIASVMEKYVDIQSLLGKGIDRKYLDSLYKVQIAAQQQSVASQKAMYDELLQRKQAFEAKMQEQGSLSETEQEQYEALMETFMEVHENMLDALQTTLDTMRTQYENTIESIFEDFEENMLGAAWSLQGLADSYSYYQEVQDRQLSAAQEIYQMSKLNRQIEQSIEDATTKANKQILKDLQAQINARAELGEMTEYDIEMMDLQYQMALKKMALEEAQAAKSVVRLTRDNDGNYAYQYTADEDQVNQAYQEYEDVLAQINDLASSRVGELEQQMLDAQQTYLEKLKELALDETMSEEEKIRKKQELYEQYQETLMWIQEQYQIATGDLQNNLAASSSWYNTTITEDSDTAKEKLAEMIENAEDWVDAYWNLINGEDNSISSAFTDYAAAIAEVNDIIQTLLTEEGAQAFLDMADNAGEMAHEVVQQLNDELDEIDAVTAAWDAQKAAIEGVKNEYEALAGQINSVIAALAQLTDEEREALTPEAFAAYWAAAGGNRQETEEEQRATAERNHRADNDVRTEEEKRADAEIEANAGMPTEDEQNAEEDKEERDTIYKENVQKSSGTSATMVTEISDILEAKLQALLGELMTYSGADMVVKDSTIDTTYVTQEVEINAEFPNVEHMQDIKDALDMLINEASQRAGKNRP